MREIWALINDVGKEESAPREQIRSALGAESFKCVRKSRFRAGALRQGKLIVRERKLLSLQSIIGAQQSKGGGAVDSTAAFGKRVKKMNSGVVTPVGNASPAFHAALFPVALGKKFRRELK